MNFPEQSFAAEKQPLREPVIRLDLVCTRRELLPHLGAAQVLEEEAGPNDAAEFAEGRLEAIAPAVRAQPAEQQREIDTNAQRIIRPAASPTEKCRGRRRT